MIYLYKCYNQSMDFRQIQAVLTRECKIYGSKPLLAGISGGADSLCLLFLLSALKLPVIAAYFDHKLRPESAQEASIIAQFAAQAGCDFIAGVGDVRLLAKMEGLGIEAAARKARYTFLFEHAQRVGAQAVAVGHTADDQVETILLHLLRGSGLDGLKGMSYRSFLPGFSQEIPLVRPLLGIWREETAAFCAERGLNPLEDRTNQDKRYARNRLRHELIPELESYNPQVKKRLWTLAQVAQASLSDTDDIGEWAYRCCLIQESPGQFVALHVGKLSELADKWLAKIIRIAVQRIHAEPANLDYRAIERAIQLLRRPNATGQVDLTANMALIKIHGRVYITDRRYPIPTTEWPQITSNESITLRLPGRTQIGAGWWIQAEYRMIEAGAAIPDEPTEAWLDSQAVSLPLTVRAWRNGDRLQPIGMSGSIKIADFFVNQKVPRIARGKWPLVESGGEVAWVVGLRISEKFRMKPDADRAIQLKLVRE